MTGPTLLLQVELFPRCETKSQTAKVALNTHGEEHSCKIVSLLCLVHMYNHDCSLAPRTRYLSQKQPSSLEGTPCWLGHANNVDE